MRPGEEEAEWKIDDEEKVWWCGEGKRNGQDVEADGGEAEGG